MTSGVDVGPAVQQPRERRGRNRTSTAPTLEELAERGRLPVPGAPALNLSEAPVPEQRLVVDTSSTGPSAQSLRIAMLGTRGVPAKYGGFETAVEEVGRRLVSRGHAVTVYCRSTPGPRLLQHLGMQLVHLPAVRKKMLETLSHTGASAAHDLFAQRQDVALVFNAGNAPFVPLLKARGIPVATHMDGLEWQRSKWGGAGRNYYRCAESVAVRWSDALIADAQGIADYYRDQFDAQTVLIPYGAPILRAPSSDRLAELGVEPGRFHVMVARFEPENHVALAITGYLRSGATLPLLVVGSAPYADEYTARVRALADSDPRVRLLGAVWDQDRLDQLYAHALTYLHGHSVGGTNPSLLRAIGAATAPLAYDVGFNREVVGDDGRFWGDPDQLARLLEQAEAEPEQVRLRGLRLQQHAERHYRWDDVADRYERLCLDLAEGTPLRNNAAGRRSRSAGRR